MAIDIKNISSAAQKLTSSISSQVGTLSSAATSLTRFIPNTAGVTVLNSSATQLSTAATSIATRLQQSAIPFSNIISAANNLAQLPRQTVQATGQLGTITAFTSDLPQSLSSSVGGSSAKALQQINSFNREFEDSLLTSTEKIPNPLREYNHYNYIITLGILTINEINNPVSYRNGGFSKIILRSGGGQYGIRQRVFLEGEENAEYFIENLEIDALIAPNEKTGISMGTTISFTVTEPYSMGKFIEALIAASLSAGYTSFNNAPYCLKVEFVGWNEPGDKILNSVAAPYYIPILITIVDFDVTAGGSTYQVQAVPYSEISLSSQVDTVNTDIKSTGKFVHEILENGDLAVTSIINKSMESIEEKTTVSDYDRYMILFPKTPTTISEAIRSKVITEEGQRRAVEQLTSSQGTVTDELRFRAERDFFKNRVSVRANAEIYQILKSLAVDTAQMNSLGNSEIDIKPLASGTQISTPPQGIYDDAIFRVARRNAAAAQPDQKSREFIFEQGTRITEIIERVLLESKVVKEEAAKDMSKGSPKMYRIETYTFAVDNPVVEKIIGRNPRIYVYAVHPYVSDQAHYLAANQKPTTTEQLKRTSVKEYNYFYTGKNEDIINFDIKYNYAFLQAVHADFGQLTAAERTKTQGSGIAGEDTLNISPPTGGSSDTKANPSLTRVSKLSRVVPGSISSDALGQLALNLHDMFINSNIDLINAEMKIWGDPYYLPTILGNYSPASSTSMLTQDQGINYLRNDVTVIVNFLNPLDYEINGSLMTYGKDINPAFSGIYQVISVTSQFQQGKFTQDIKMLRQRGQENNTEGSQKVLSVSQGTSLNSAQPTASKSASTSTITTTNPAATLTNIGQVIDTRAGIWTNQAIGAAATSGTTIAATLVNPIAGLTNVGRLLANVPANLQPVLSNIKVNSPLATKPTTQITPVSGPQ